MNRLYLAAVSCLATAAAHVQAQETLRLDVMRASTPVDPVVEMVIWAVFDPADYAFRHARFEIEATSGSFSDTQCIPIQPGTLCLDPGPWHLGPIVKNVSAAQLHSPALGFFAVLSNPVAIIKTRWRPDAPAADDVRVITRTTIFNVYVDDTGAWESRLDTFTEGSAIIRVRRCYADCDGTDDIDFFDFLCFQTAFIASDYYADCDTSGELDFFDFLCFQNAFAAGCQ